MIGVSASLRRLVRDRLPRFSRDTADFAIAIRTRADALPTATAYVRRPAAGGGGDSKGPTSTPRRRTGARAQAIDAAETLATTGEYRSGWLNYAQHGQRGRRHPEGAGLLVASPPTRIVGGRQRG